MKEQLEEKKKIHKWGEILLTVLLVLAVGMCLYVVIQVRSLGYVNLGGFMMFRVVTGSMEPTIATGALLIAREVDIASIRLDDIVCFRTQVSEIWGNIVTHRVVSVLQEPTGSILLETKGDANLVSDIFFVDKSNFVGKVVWYSGSDNLLAGILSVFTNKIGFLGCIVFPTLLISSWILRDSVASIKQEMLAIMEEESRELEKGQNQELDPLCGMTQEEYNEMYERIRAELMEELAHIYDGVHKEVPEKENDGAETPTTE